MRRGVGHAAGFGQGSLRALCSPRPPGRAHGQRRPAPPRPADASRSASTAGGERSSWHWGWDGSVRQMNLHSRVGRGADSPSCSPLVCRGVACKSGGWRAWSFTRPTAGRVCRAPLCALCSPRLLGCVPGPSHTPAIALAAASLICKRVRAQVSAGKGGPDGRCGRGPRGSQPGTRGFHADGR